jgi:arylsulfatase A-like enzyme
MNFILIISDSLRADYLGCYGSEWVETPAMDALAREGVLFRNAYAASFPTGPMRKDTHTGRFTFPYASWQDQDGGEPVLAECLTDAGYHTALIGDTFCIGAYRRGFTEFHFIPGQNPRQEEGEGEGPGPASADAAKPRPLPADLSKLRAPMERLQAILARLARIRCEEETFVAQTMRRAACWLEGRYRASEPFFLCIDTFDPHEPWYPPRYYIDRYDPGYRGQELLEPAYWTSEYASEEEIRHMRCMYAGEVSLVDRWIGHFLDAVRRLGFWDSTAVLVTSDHGFYHGEHGYIGKVQLSRDGGIIRRWPLYATIAHIPLVVKLPEGPASAERNAFCQPPDIMPTILDLAGVPIPQSVTGASLSEAVRDGAAAVRDAAASSTTYVQDDAVRSPTAFRTRDALYIYGGDECPSRLYDLRRDPGEENDILPEQEARGREAHEKYLRFLEAIGCPEARMDGRRDFRPVPRSGLPETRII